MPQWPFRTGPLEIPQNRAVRPVVALAAVGKLLERVTHRPHLGDLCFKFGDMIERNPFDLGALPVLVLPEADEVLDAFDAEAQRAGSFDEAQDIDLVRRVDPVSRSGSTRLRDQSDPFVVPDEFGIDAGRFGGLTDVHHDLIPINYPEYRIWDRQS